MSYLSEEPDKKDRLLCMKLDAARWVWTEGVDQEIVEAMLLCKYPNERYAVREIVLEAFSRRLKPGALVWQKGVKKLLTDIETLNSRFAQLECRRQAAMTIQKLDGMPLTDKDFEKRVSGEVVYAGIDKTGVPYFAPAKEAWYGSCEKARYTKLVFTSKPVDSEAYNLFPGFGVEPVAGEWDLLRQHLLQVICSGNIEDYDALINLLAWQVQHIGEPSRVVLCLHSQKQQSGKSIFLTYVLGAIYGEAALITSDTEKILSRFNSTLRGKAYVCLEEALFSKSKKSADAVKSLVTATEMALEGKFLDATMSPVAVNLFLATNHESCADIEPADKRYWILNVSESRVDDKPYFEALTREIKNGGREAFLEYLLSVDVEDFLPSRDVPMNNEAKKLMIEQSINPCSAYVWLRESAETGIFLGSRTLDIPMAQEWITEVTVDSGYVYEWYQTWARGNKSYRGDSPDSQKKLSQALELGGVKPCRSNNARKRSFPSPKVCLENLLEARKLGKVGGY